MVRQFFQQERTAGFFNERFSCNKEAIHCPFFTPVVKVFTCLVKLFTRLVKNPDCIAPTSIDCPENIPPCRKFPQFRLSLVGIDWISKTGRTNQTLCRNTYTFLSGRSRTSSRTIWERPAMSCTLPSGARIPIPSLETLYISFFTVRVVTK